MGIFTTPSSRFYVPPVGRQGRSPHGTLLGGPPPAPLTWYDDDSNVVRVSGGNARAPDSNVQVAQHPPSAPVAAPSDDYHLKFDGRYLKLFKGDEVVKEWPGVSGKENFGSSRDQEKKNYGPIPEGTYDIKQSRHEVMDPLRQRLWGLGRWRGGTSSWGTERVWIDPTKDTVTSGLTLGRSDMAIHGGDVPGSAGCIDLTGQMDDFAKTFRQLGRDLRLYVDYSPPVPESSLNRNR